MKRKSRDINIFSMSALDLFASAMGAFVIIAVIMFPYFPNTGDSPERVANVRAEMQGQIDELQEALRISEQDLAQCQTQNAQLQSQNAQLQSQNQQLQSENAQLQSQNADLQSQLNQCQAQLARCQNQANSLGDQLEACMRATNATYLVVIISWSTQGDDVDLHVVDPMGREYYYNATEFPGSPARLEEDNVNGPGNEVWQHPEATPGQYKVYYNYFNNPAGSTVVRGYVLHKDGRSVLPDRRLTRASEKPLVATIVVANDGSVSVR